MSERSAADRPDPLRDPKTGKLQDYDTTHTVARTLSGWRIGRDKATPDQVILHLLGRLSRLEDLQDRPQCFRCSHWLGRFHDSNSFWHNGRHVCLICINHLVVSEPDGFDIPKMGAWVYSKKVPVHLWGHWADYLGDDGRPETDLALAIRFSAGQDGRACPLRDWPQVAMKLREAT